MLPQHFPEIIQHVPSQQGEYYILSTAHTIVLNVQQLGMELNESSRPSVVQYWFSWS